MNDALSALMKPYLSPVLISAAPPQPWTFIEAKTLLHVESSLESGSPGVPVCSVPKSKRDLAALITELGSVTELEWQAILDALIFTAANAGVVSDAHERAVDHVSRILGNRQSPTATVNPCSA